MTCCNSDHASSGSVFDSLIGSIIDDSVFTQFGEPGHALNLPSINPPLNSVAWEVLASRKRMQANANNTLNLNPASHIFKHLLTLKLLRLIDVFVLLCRSMPFK